MTKYRPVLLLVLMVSGLFVFYSCIQERTASVKIMSYNMRHGEGMDTIIDLSRSAKIIKSQAPDLCGLQEVDDFCQRTGSVGQTDYLAQYTSMIGTFAKFMDYQGGEYGMATLTTKPLISTKRLSLPDGKYEPRTSIVHEVQITDACIIAFANVHFDWIDDKEGIRNRLDQAKTLVKYLDDIDRASIITGDFNCTPDSPTMRYFTEQGFVFVPKGEDNISFQGKNKAEIDHVIYRNSKHVKFKRKSVQLIDEPIVSDHRPLIVELELIF